MVLARTYALTYAHPYIEHAFSFSLLVGGIEAPPSGRLNLRFNLLLPQHSIRDTRNANPSLRWSFYVQCGNGDDLLSQQSHAIDMSNTGTASSVRSGTATPRLKDDRVILHFDYDCFYASVFEAETPELKSLPLAVQQKQIVVTCNYEARRRGLYKLQLITEAKKICPDVVIVLGEDLTRFRAASKELYAFLSSFVWSKQCERLGLDEVWLDVTDMVNYQIPFLNSSILASSFFQLDKDDPTIGFPYDPRFVSGGCFPEQDSNETPILPLLSLSDPSTPDLHLRIGSHLAQYLRRRLENEKGYTASVGVAVNKLLSKLIGNTNKPNGQTTMLPPLQPRDIDTTDGYTAIQNTAIAFLDKHDIGRVPGIGFKLSTKLRSYVLSRPATYHSGLVTNRPKETILLRDIRLAPGMSPRLLEKIFGPGAPKGIGVKVWAWMHGVDSEEVAKVKAVPTQISLEDSYLKLDALSDVKKELLKLSLSLVRRMFLDLTESILLDETSPQPGKNGDHGSGGMKPEKESPGATANWLAIPRTLRLSTRPRPPIGPDGTRTRSFARISHSRPMPRFILSKTASQDETVRRLVEEALMPMFKKLHPKKSGWNLSLINVAATNMVETAAGSDKSRDIGDMFRRREKDVLDTQAYDVTPEIIDQGVVEEKSTVNSPAHEMRKMDYGGLNYGTDQEDPSVKRSGYYKFDGLQDTSRVVVLERTPNSGSEDLFIPSQSSNIDEDSGWQSDGSSPLGSYGEVCSICLAKMPSFALEAHLRYHEMETD